MSDKKNPNIIIIIFQFIVTILLNILKAIGIFIFTVITFPIWFTCVVILIYNNEEYGREEY